MLGGGPNCGLGAPDVQNENFSLLNWLKLDHSVMWPNFNELGCFLTNCSKWGVRQQMTITWDVQQTIFPIYNGTRQIPLVAESISILRILMVSCSKISLFASVSNSLTSTCSNMNIFTLGTKLDF